MKGENLGVPDPFPGEFRFRRLLCEGAFGKVWLADDLKLGRQVALKTLKPPATCALRPQVLAALRKDAQCLAALNHPNLVGLHAWRQAGGEYFLVLQFVAGGSLADKLRAGRSLGWQTATRYVADVGEALVEAHKRGVIHRDIKPENILLDSATDEAILTDFGFSARLANPGSPAGTRMYLAPEAFTGLVSPAVDVYSLAATLYRLVTGEPPFAEAPDAGLMRQKLQGLPDPDPRCEGMPEGVEWVIRAATAGKAELRPKLPDFVAALRGSLNQLLADALATPGGEAGGQAPVNLRLVVSRRVHDDVYQPLAAAKPRAGRLTRDLATVPRPPERVGVTTGDRVRIEVVADKTGYVTVFNIGPTGNLNLLYPELQAAIGPPLDNNRPLHILDVEMTPPAGRERLLAVWSRAPLGLRLDQLRSLAESGASAASRPRAVTRDMHRIKEAVRKFGPEDWQAAVVELDHAE
jgi:serine/threonine protein kinase